MKQLAISFIFFQIATEITSAKFKHPTQNRPLDVSSDKVSMVMAPKSILNDLKNLFYVCFSVPVIGNCLGIVVFTKLNIDYTVSK